MNRNSTIALKGYIKTFYKINKKSAKALTLMPYQLDLTKSGKILYNLVFGIVYYIYNFE